MYHLDSDHRHIFRHHPQKHFTIIVHFAVIYILYYEQKKTRNLDIGFTNILPRQYIRKLHQYHTTDYSHSRTVTITFSFIDLLNQ